MARLVANGPVSAEIAKRVEEYSRTAGLSVVALLEQAKLIAFSDIRQLFDENGKLLHPTQWPEGVAAAVAGFDLDWGTGEDGEPLPVGRAAKVRLCDKPDALRTLLGFSRGSVIAEQSLPELDATISRGTPEA